MNEPDSLSEQALQEQWPDNPPEYDHGDEYDAAVALAQLFRQYEDDIPWRAA